LIEINKFIVVFINSVTKRDAF